MQTYCEINVTAVPFDPEVLTGFLWETQPIGIEETDNALRLFFEKADSSEEVEELLRGLQENGIISTFSVSSEVKKNRNWNEEWEKSLQVIRVSDKIVIRPTFKEYTPQPGELVLVIDPKMSFGTGEHQTTKIVLRLLEKYNLEKARVLDAGTGTGILAIAAIKLGAAFAVAFDNDDWCLENGIENAALNEIPANQIKILTADITQIGETGFDVTIANIQKNILLEIKEELLAKTRQGGIIMLSGLLRQDETDMLLSYSDSGAQHLETIVMDEWIGIVLRKL